MGRRREGRCSSLYTCPVTMESLGVLAERMREEVVGAVAQGREEVVGRESLGMVGREEEVVEHMLGKVEIP